MEIGTDCGRAVPFLGIFPSNFRYCVFAVCYELVIHLPEKVNSLTVLDLTFRVPFLFRYGGNAI